MATTGALATGALAVTVAATWNDSKHMSLQSVVDAARAGDTVEISRGWLIGTPVVVNKALTIRCVRGGSVTTTKDVHAFDVMASSVRFEQVALRGVAESRGDKQAAIRVTGTLKAPIKGLRILRCIIVGFAKNGIEAHHVHSPLIEANTIERAAYGGIMIFSGKGGRIAGNTIRNVTMRTLKNAYGIALTRMYNQPLAQAPHTSGTIVTGNLVDGVPGWEGIDTHAGRDISILNNTVRNCRVGIAVVPGRNPAGVYVYAPTGIRVIGNTIDSTVTDGSRRPGIQVIGATSSTGKVNQYASAEVASNTVTGHGTQNTGNQSGIHIEATRQTTVRSNKLISCSPNGIHAYHSNEGLVIEKNTFTDTWSQNQDFAACVYISGTAQSLTVRENKAIRGKKKAKLVNERGLFVRAEAKRPGTTVTASGNSFTACVKPIVDASKSQKLT